MPEKHAWARWFWLTMGACALAQLVLAGATAGYEADYNTFWAWALRAAFCWALPPGPALRFCM